MGVGASVRGRCVTPPRVLADAAAFGPEGAHAKDAADVHVYQSAWGTNEQCNDIAPSKGLVKNTSEVWSAQSESTAASQSDLYDRRHQSGPSKLEALDMLSRVEDYDEEQIATPKSLASVSHLNTWAEPSETLVLLDWDDTLYPTTSLDAADLRRVPEDPAKLRAHYEAVTHLLQVAAQISHVAIVTMATSAWIESGIQKIFPGLHDTLTEYAIDIVPCRKEEYFREAKADCRDVSTFLKTKAMRHIIKEFYRGKSWKNMMSIGDSPAERLALQDVSFLHMQRDRRGVWKDSRCKVISLTSQPSLEELTQELQVVTNWLPTLLQHDGDLDLEIDTKGMTLVGDGLPGY